MCPFVLNFQKFHDSWRKKMEIVVLLMFQQYIEGLESKIFSFRNIQKKSYAIFSEKNMFKMANLYRKSMKKGIFPLISTISAHFRALILSELQVYANRVSLSAKLHWSTLVNQRFCKFSMKKMRLQEPKLAWFNLNFFQNVFHFILSSI